MSTNTDVLLRLLWGLMLQKLDPCILIESAIVRMVMSDLTPMLVCVSLECLFCIQSLCLVSQPFSCPMNKVVLDSSWSIDTIAPGEFTGGTSISVGGALVRQGFLVAFAYRHAVHFGGLTFRNLRGMIPTSAAS